MDNVKGEQLLEGVVPGCLGVFGVLKRCTCLGQYRQV
jgi:hypothetical protein